MSNTNQRAVGYGLHHTHCLKGGTEKRLMSLSRSATGIPGHSLTASTFLQDFSFRAPLLTATQTQLPTNLLSRAPGDSFRGLQRVVGFLHQTFARAPTYWTGSGDSKTDLRKEPRMAETYLYLPNNLAAAVWAHLLEDESGAESAGFLFAKHRREGEVHGFEALEWYPVPPEGFLSRNSYHFVLTDEVRAEVIKRAHDLGASVVEFHCHKGPRPARFSLSDQAGFQEFVPHIWWRLRGRPYLAVVVAEIDFDSLVWVTGPGTPQHLTGIVVDETTFDPTRLSSLGQECDEQYAF